MIPIVVPAYAKINLAIDVVGKKKKSNYHYLDMVMIPVLLHDTIELSIISNPTSFFSCLYCDDPNIDCDESNTAYKALSIYQDLNEVDTKFKIFIYKRIPVEAGLGGGSADAAAVLKALYKFTSKDNGLTLAKTHPLYDKNILAIAPKIGADVPFSLLNKPAHVTGIGEIMEPIEVKNAYNVLIVKPKGGLSTGHIFRLYDETSHDNIKHPNIKELIKGLKEDNEELIQNNLLNVLTFNAIDELPIIEDILEKFKSFNLPMSGMSGTGSSCFALNKDKKKLVKAKRYFQKMGCDAILTKFII